MKDKKHPVRKDMRWEKQDYSHPGEYAITICVKDNKQILSRVVKNDSLRGVEAPPPTNYVITENKTHANAANRVCLRSCESEQTVGDGAPDVPQTAKVILTPYGKIVEKHIKSSTRMSGITILKYVIMPNHVHILVGIEQETEEENTAKKEKTPANELIPRFVGVLKRLTHREIGEKIFQRSYYDHVIRDDNDLTGAETYIDENPIRWLEEN